MTDKQEPVDWKFTIRATALHNGKRHTERESVLLLCKDKALVETLQFYRFKAVRVWDAAQGGAG